MTFAARVYVNTGETEGYILSKPWNGGGEYNYRLMYKTNGTINFFVDGSGAGSSIETPVTREVRTHIVGTVDGYLLKMYKDGVLVKTGAHGITNWTPNLGNIDKQLSIGTLYPYGATSSFPGGDGEPSFSFSGRVDDVRIYNRALHISEVQKLYAATNQYTT